MQAPEIEPRVAALVIDSLAADLFRFAKGFQRQGRRSEFTVKVADDESLTAAYLFRPRSQVLELDGLPESFRGQVRPFNVLGMIRDRGPEGVAKGRVVLDLLAGQSKPFASLRSPVEMRAALYPGSVLTFVNHLLRCRGLEKDISEFGYDEFRAELRRRETENRAQGPAPFLPPRP
jgi:hypothetical protein